MIEMEVKNTTGLGEVVILRHSSKLHPHLEVVLCYLKNKNEYVTWIYNKSNPGYGYGNYFNANEKGQVAAVEDYLQRVAEYNLEENELINQKKLYGFWRKRSYE